MRILVISNVVPYPPHSGIQLRILRILESVARVHEVTFCCHAWDAGEEQNARELAKRGMRVFTGRMRHPVNLQKVARAARFGFSGKPPELALYRSPELVKILRDLFRDEEFDILQVEESILAHYVELLPRGAATRRLLTFHDVHFVQAARAAALEQSAGMRLWRRFNSFCMRSYEPRLVRQFEQCITVTGHDRTLLQPFGPLRKIGVVLNGVDTATLEPLPEACPTSILFVGSLFYKPCEDGAVWLVETILPLIRREFPQIDCWIVGKGPGSRVRDLAGEHVFVTGEVEDLRPYYERAAVALAPLRAGSGSRLKILEAMALARPVVSTTIGVEGLDAEAEKHLLVADGAPAFAAAVIRLLRSVELRRSLTAAAREFVEAQHDWEAIGAAQLRIYREMFDS